MKFQVDRSQFAEAVAWAGRTVPAKHSNPLLSGLRLEASDLPSPSLSISAFDYEISGRVETPAEIFEPGTVLVTGRLLVEIAKSLPAAPVEVIAEGSRVRVRSGRSTFELPSLPVEDYPTLPAMPEVNGSVPGAVFAAAVAQVAVAAWRDPTLEYLTGVRVEVDAEVITLAATDRYRLAVRQLRWQPMSPDFSASALVPARTLAETAKALATAEDVHLAFGSHGAGEGLLGIEGMRRRTTTRLLDGDFPKYRSLLPSQSPIVARVETAALTEAVKRVSLVAERSSAIRMTFSGSELHLEAGTGDDAIGADAIECQLTGGPIERIAFNAGYLLDGLAAIGRPVTNMAFTLPTKPTVLTGAASFDADAADDYLYLLMPVRLVS